MAHIIWTYNEEDEAWSRPDGWVYDPQVAAFYITNQPENNKVLVPLDNVTLEVRITLETAARNLIDGILGQENKQEMLPEPVAIQNEFQHITQCEVLGADTFGSTGASSGLIVFATGVQQGQMKVVGANLHFGQIREVEEAVNIILEHLGALDDGEQIRFDIFGGQVGCNTNPGEGKFMDYSLYYPFILKLSQHGNIAHYNFPANGEDNGSIGAAITENGVSVWHIEDIPN